MTHPDQALFVIDSDDVDGEHRYVRVIPRDSSRLATELAPRIRSAYFNLRAAEQRLRDAADDLARFDATALVTEEEIEAALEEELNAVLPADWKGGRPKHTDTQRSELAEIIAAHVLATIFQAVIPASRIAHKEIPDQQTRGVDVLAFEDVTENDLKIVIGEVKGSSDTKSPPGVVLDMAVKLPQLASDRRALAQELIWLRDNCDEEYAQLCSLLCSRFLLKRADPDLVLAPLLIRTRATAGEADYGKFRTDASAFTHRIRFTTIILDVEDLFQFATSVYKEARRLVDQ